MEGRGPKTGREGKEGRWDSTEESDAAWDGTAGSEACGEFFLGYPTAPVCWDWRYGGEDDRLVIVVHYDRLELTHDRDVHVWTWSSTSSAPSRCSI